jgi:hypothetical protein
MRSTVNITIDIDHDHGTRHTADDIRGWIEEIVHVRLDTPSVVRAKVSSAFVARAATPKVVEGDPADLHKHWGVACDCKDPLVLVAGETQADAEEAIARRYDEEAGPLVLDTKGPFVETPLRATPTHQFANGVNCYDPNPIIWANGEDCLHEDPEEFQRGMDAAERRARCE